MRTTLDLPEPLLRSLKVQAAQSGKSLKALLNELIVRAMAMPSTPPAATTQPLLPVLPVLSRLSDTAFDSTSKTLGTNFADLEFQEDMDKLRRSGFIQ